jgi:hypothetical protein
MHRGATASSRAMIFFVSTACLCLVGLVGLFGLSFSSHACHSLMFGSPTPSLTSSPPSLELGTATTPFQLLSRTRPPWHAYLRTCLSGRPCLRSSCLAALALLLACSSRHRTGRGTGARALGPVRPYGNPRPVGRRPSKPRGRWSRYKIARTLLLAMRVKRQEPPDRCGTTNKGRPTAERVIICVFSHARRVPAGAEPTPSRRRTGTVVSGKGTRFHAFFAHWRALARVPPKSC